MTKYPSRSDSEITHERWPLVVMFGGEQYPFKCDLIVVRLVERATDQRNQQQTKCIDYRKVTRASLVGTQDRWVIPMVSRWLGLAWLGSTWFRLNKKKPYNDIEGPFMLIR